MALAWRLADEQFPLAQSTTKSAENTQGGMVMNNRMKKYANAIEVCLNESWHRDAR
jgi:hypothetical protein